LMLSVAMPISLPKFEAGSRAGVAGPAHGDCRACGQLRTVSNWAQAPRSGFSET
jgi:hypothetical protein